ncbi:hypothetical protein EV401DRAFT_2173830, partial [Pisolithus croceorrhizus]
PREGVTEVQNSTALGKFPTLQSMVGHAIVCLLVFEHAYFLMQQSSHGWEEALTMAVNRCKSAHIQTTISTAVKEAFQQKGNNVADLCETILRIIGENKILHKGSGIRLLPILAGGYEGWHTTVQRLVQNIGKGAVGGGGGLVEVGTVGYLGKVEGGRGTGSWDIRREVNAIGVVVSFNLTTSIMVI